MNRMFRCTSFWSRVLRVLATTCVLTQFGCAKVAYITQAAAGQDDLENRARDIDTMLNSGRVDGKTARLLVHVGRIKLFGERHGLSATPNYTKYVRLERPAAVWVVSASEPFRFRSESWSFPLVGSFTYLGWFKREDADAFADELRREGWDVDVRGAGAYSTGGFFRDPVLSTMIPRGKGALGGLANTILHEMTHATVFIRHQSTLNESVANFVGDRLAEAYLAEAFGLESEERSAYLAAERASDQRGRAMHEAFMALEKLYGSEKSREEKSAEKQALLDALRAKLKFSRPINNATLIQFRTYHSGQAELATLLEACGGDWPRFLGVLKKLEPRAFGHAQDADIGRVFARVASAGCSSP